MAYPQTEEKLILPSDLTSHKVTKVITGLVAEEHDTIRYRPAWAKYFGSVNAAILLQQINYWWVKCGRKPFWKFKEPCDHDLYKTGQSWCEELSFSKHEFNQARGKLGKKKPRSTDEPKQSWNCLISYWIDQQRRTWYWLNERKLQEMCECLYLKPESGDRKSRKSDLVYNNVTETTTETTTNRSSSKKLDPSKEFEKNTIHRVITYLNRKIGSQYRSSTKVTQRLIRARLNDGFKPEDFKVVIDNQVAKWQNTEFEDYLRPQTLFGTKFESYLNNGKFKKQKIDLL